MALQLLLDWGVSTRLVEDFRCIQVLQAPESTPPSHSTDTGHVKLLVQGLATQKFASSDSVCFIGVLSVAVPCASVVLLALLTRPHYSTGFSEFSVRI
eukprot:m.395509 g.395509  ORF g.395509 m.395509 type:complete len:98 (+) comp16771_c0_seq1:119-412(+)